ncbi:MAG: tRNA uridine(34) 5-carboxymethylaminomethyl modification radical SAM/GNAT enzyme Elp3 [Nanoarchaeota archaeon]|nr:tRNA uridine(34) 5-carboxymethylaminomethyl modification radical SAM/GNAT enzyme Elp3 [Nanoarchaeota archaeon]
MDNKQILKPTKTISGVAPLPVMLPPRRCEHGSCTYCPNLDAPQSYTPLSPGVLRAKESEYDPYRQVESRLNSLKKMNHPTDKIELIIMGGTFMSYPENFQFSFVKGCYDAMNGKISKDIEEAKKINETATNRIVAICIETRPDVCTDHHIKNMLKWGTTRVELGVQAIDDEIYKKINRCHDLAAVIDTTRRLKKAGFKIGYHIMPGLPGSSIKHDIEMFKEIFDSPNFKPDQIKIYPCQVLKGAAMEHLYYAGKYIPYNLEETARIIIKTLLLTPNYCRIMRIMREIPPTYLIAGVKTINMRKDVEEKIRESGETVNEIRFREIGFALRDNREIKTDLHLKTTEYKASGGTEFFIEWVNEDDILFGLVRLRLEDNSKEMATIRELHVYGPTLKLNESAKEEWQHKGLGKKLMKEAERIAKESGHKKIRVISGVGVREYYKKLGYTIDKDNIYVEKDLS